VCSVLHVLGASGSVRNDRRRPHRVPSVTKMPRSGCAGARPSWPGLNAFHPRETVQPEEMPAKIYPLVAVLLTYFGTWVSGCGGSARQPPRSRRLVELLLSRA
jgi:hypothetical protein